MGITKDITEFSVQELLEERNAGGMKHMDTVYLYLDNDFETYLRTDLDEESIYNPVYKGAAYIARFVEHLIKSNPGMGRAECLLMVNGFISHGLHPVKALTWLEMAGEPTTLLEA